MSNLKKQEPDFKVYFLRNRRNNSLICVGAELTRTLEDSREITNFAFEKTFLRIPDHLELIRKSEKFEIRTNDDVKISVEKMFEIIKNEHENYSTWQNANLWKYDKQLQRKYRIVENNENYVCKRDFYTIDDGKRVLSIMKHQTCHCYCDYEKSCFKVFVRGEEETYSSHYNLSETQMLKYFSICCIPEENHEKRNLFNECDGLALLTEDVYVRNGQENILWTTAGSTVAYKKVEDGKAYTIHTELKDLRISIAAFNSICTKTI